MSIKFENVVTPSPEQWTAIIYALRNPMNSWSRIDSEIKYENARDNAGKFIIGPNDLDLMKRLRNAGTDHRKFMRMIIVYVNITAPLYWWKEFDTYRVGVEKNSCSTMHKIMDKKFTLDDFSCEHLDIDNKQRLMHIIDILNATREEYLGYDKALKSKGVYGINPEIKRDAIKQKQKDIWWQMIQLLPSSYNQKRTVMMSYEVLANVYKSRKNHKLAEWKEHTNVWGFAKSTCSMDSEGDCKNPNEYLLCEKCDVGKGFCDWIKTLPYSELITGDFKEE